LAMVYIIGNNNLQQSLKLIKKHPTYK